MMTKALQVSVLLPEGQDCVACAERLRTRLGEMKGVAAAEVDATGRTLTVTYDPALLSLPALESRVREAGAALTRRFRHATLRLEGLHCPDCAGAVEHGVRHNPGVLSASASFAAASLHVEYDADATDLERIATAVSHTGYRALPPGTGSDAVVIRVPEMDCQDEGKAIEGKLRNLQGIGSWQGNCLASPGSANEAGYAFHSGVQPGWR